MVSRRIKAGIGLALFIGGCGVSGTTGDSLDARIDSPDGFTDNLPDGYYPNDDGFKPDDSPYLTDENGIDGKDTPYDTEDTEVPQYDVDNWDSDNPLDVVDAYDFGKDIYNPDEGVNSEDLYQVDAGSSDDGGLEDIASEEINSNPCNTIASVCTPEYRDPITGKCNPLELKVDFDEFFDVCLDYSDSSYEDSLCYLLWKGGSVYKLPSQPGGSKSDCPITWHFSFEEDTCGKWGNFSSSTPHMVISLAANQSILACIGLEDTTGQIFWDSQKVFVIKK